MTLIDLFREFSHVATVESYPKSARLLYYTMLYYWNEQKRPDVARLPHAQLYTLAGLPEATYREAFKYLADEGWIKRVKSRVRSVSAWRMRDRCAKTAPPAGFPLSPARQSDSPDRRKEESPCGDSSLSPNESAEVPANVRTDSNTRDERTVAQTCGTTGTQTAELQPNVGVSAIDYIAIPEFER